MTAALDRLFDALRSTNPFLSPRIIRPSGTEVDVEGIHDAEFRRLVVLAEQARDQKRGLGCILWGDSGTGKSNMLSRLSRWSHERRRAAFIYLNNVRVSPERLPQYVLSAVLSVWTLGRQEDYFGTPLYDLVLGLIQEVRNRAAGPGTRPTEAQMEKSFRGLLNELVADDPTRFNRTVFDALFRFYLSANAAHHTGRDDGVASLAMRWLSGEPLDREEGKRLHLRPGLDPLQLHEDEQVKQVFVALTYLAWLQKRPFVICYDQAVELERPEAATALFTFLHSLLDASVNLLVVLTSVEGIMRGLRQQGVIPEAGWQRCAQTTISLRFITPEQGRAVLEARLKKFLGPFAGLPEVQACLSRDALFPLGTAWLKTRLQDRLELRPGLMIHWANERWQHQQDVLQVTKGTDWLKSWDRLPQQVGPRPVVDDAALIDPLVARKIQEQKNARIQQTSSLLPDADNLAGLVFELLKQCLNHPERYPLVAVHALSRDGTPKYDLVVRLRGPDGRETQMGLRCLLVTDPNSTSYVLRLLADDDKPSQRVVLVTEVRRPLKLPKAKHAKGRQHWEKLTARPGFERLELSIAQYAELDALHAIVVQARQGDLEVEQPDGELRPVSDQDVIDSHHRQGRYLAHPLLRRLLTLAPSSVEAGATAPRQTPVPSPPGPSPGQTSTSTTVPEPEKKNERSRPGISSQPGRSGS